MCVCVCVCVCVLQMRLDTFGEAKKLMNAAFDPIDPLNMHDYEPPHEQANLNPSPDTPNPNR